MIDYGIFDSLFDAVLVINADRKILYCNEMAASLALSSVKRLTKGVVFSDVFHLNEPHLFPVSGGELGRTTPSPTQELEFSIKNQSRSGKIQVTVQPFSEQNEPRWVVILHDVTLEATLHQKYQGELELKEGFIQDLQTAKAQLENYSKNLEAMVAERTAEVQKANQMLNAVMNSLGQGFVIFGPDGICSHFFTKACLDILEKNPAQHLIGEVLSLNEKDVNQFKMWMQAVFSHSLPFEDLAHLAPDRYAHSQGQYITLNFYPLRDEKNQITHVVLVATDKTEEHLSKLALAQEQSHGDMILKLIKNREHFGHFIETTRQHLVELKKQLQQSHHKEFDFASALRRLHTLEGESGLFSATTLKQLCRHTQETLEPFRQSQTAIVNKEEVLQKFKMQFEKLEDGFQHFLLENKELLDLLHIGECKTVEIPWEKLTYFAQLLMQKNHDPTLKTFFLQQILKQPLTLFLRHFDEVAHQVAQAQGKMVQNIIFDCDDVRLQPGSLEDLIASLVHAFRNAVDHGLETPEIRESLGKPPHGKLKVVARTFLRESWTWLRLMIEDDGCGIDPEKIRHLLCQRFPHMGFEKKSEFEVLQGLFLPGFSSRSQVGSFSGRGVGMDAISSEVKKLGGQVWVESILGTGTKIILEIPEPPLTETAMDLSA